VLLGSAEGFSLAEKAISSASRSGRWCQLKCSMINICIQQMGVAEECTPCSTMADAIGEEASLLTSSSQLQAVPYNGN